MNATIKHTSILPFYQSQNEDEEEENIDGIQLGDCFEKFIEREVW